MKKKKGDVDVVDYVLHCNLDVVIENWYTVWKTKISRDPRQPHNLLLAKDELKKLLKAIDVPKHVEE